VKDAAVTISDSSDAQIVLFAGSLDVYTCGEIWKSVFDSISSQSEIIADTTSLTYCDMSGIALFLAIQEFAARHDQNFEIKGLSPETERLYKRFCLEPLIQPLREPTPQINFIEKTGQLSANLFQRLFQELNDYIVFTGELSAGFFDALKQPSRIRWKDVWLVAEKSGVNALPIVSLIGFLMGLILAFQSIVPMATFGAEIFVADLIGLSMIRELGPLMTAIVLAGRTGSAFAAELGAMKVNEEIDALVTMGLDPISFLVVVRVMAALIITPILTIYADMISVLGGAIPLVSMGYPVVTYYNGVVNAVDYVDFFNGLFKSFFFGLLVAGAGCKCGLQTQTGAGAVGESTTRAVVSGIVLIVLCDGIFSVMCYYLDI